MPKALYPRPTRLFLQSLSHRNGLLPLSVSTAKVMVLLFLKKPCWRDLLCRSWDFYALQGLSSTSSTTTIQATSTIAPGSGSSHATIPAGCPTPTLTCYQCDSSFPPSSEWTFWGCMAAQNRVVMVAGNSRTVDGPDEADDVLNAIAVTADTAGIPR